jgi:hypothetical protein
MKLSKGTSLSILTILFLAYSSIPSIAHAGQDSIRTFSWEGLSLSMTPNQMVEVLENDGYTLFRVTEAKKKTFIYQRKTGTGSNKVQFIEKNGALIKLVFSDTRAGDKKNLRSPEAADSALSSIKSKLGIDDSSCTPAAKGGGKCIGPLTSSTTHNNSFNVSVKPRALKITLNSNPIAQAIFASNKETADGLASAYGCLGTIDINSVKEIYECINSVTKELEVLAKAKKISRSKHRPVNLSNFMTPCWQLSNFYKRGLLFLQNGSDGAPIPDCKTFSAVINHTVGSPAFWLGCMNEDESDEFLKSCVDSVNPSYFKLVDKKIPTCKEYQLAYLRGVVSARNTATDLSAVTPPECEHVLAFAKSLRTPLTEELLACAGYDPDKAQEHISKCIISDQDLWLLENCQQVQLIYSKKLILSNYGYLPDTYRPIACDQTKDLLVTAESARERIAEEYAEETKQAKLDLLDKMYMEEKMREKRIVEQKKYRDERYGDTPKRAATRTSKLEKEIKANGGNIKLACKALGRKNIFCPPTLEEIRLAMMRKHSKIKNMRMINGHMLYGNLGGAPVELHYKEPKLLRECTFGSGPLSGCFFMLVIKNKMDRFLQSNSDSVAKKLRYIRRYDYSYAFRIGKDGLWQAERTATQIAKDQAMQQRIQAQWDDQEEMWQRELEQGQQNLDSLQAYQ